MKVGNIESYSDLELALMVILDYLGTGNQRKQKLGIRYNNVQSLVNYILRMQQVPNGSNELSYDDVRRVLMELQPTESEYKEFVNEILIKLKEAH